jgi:hypothetical protein
MAELLVSDYLFDRWAAFLAAAGAAVVFSVLWYRFPLAQRARAASG